MTIVFIAQEFIRFGDLIARLGRDNAVELLAAATGADGLVRLQGKRADLIVVDEQWPDMSGIELTRQLVRNNPLANVALIGSQTEEVFHEATEGLGVLMQLPPRPTAADAESLLSVMAKINVLLAAPSPEAS